MQTQPDALQPTISVFGLEDSELDRPDRASFKRWEEMRAGRGEVNLEVLRARLVQFLDSIRDVVDELPRPLGDYLLDEITVNAEVSAKGRVSLLGSGGELAGKSGLTFKFKRREAPDHEGGA